MSVNVLGPLTVEGHGRPVEVRGTKRRAVLALLAVHCGRTVSAEQLADRVWPEEPPADPAASLRTLVVDLQRTLDAGGSGPRISVLGSSFRLDGRAEEVDLGAARGLARRGRAELSDGNPAAAVRLLADAERLWRGPALVDVGRSGRSWPEAAEMDETFCGLVEDRMTAQLAAGRHEACLDELPDLVDAEPLRERRYALLMLAYAGVGRVDDARAVYRRASRTLADGWGVSPGHQLRRLHDALGPAGAGPVARPPADGAGRTVPGSVLMVRSDRTTAARVRAAVEAEGGRLVDLLGGPLLGVFEADRHADSALRAARTLGGPGGGVGRPARVAVATGGLRVGPTGSAARRPVVLGEPLDACRLLLRGGAGTGVLAAASTTAACRDADLLAALAP